jgi:N-acetyl-anhydromuramyl-L-alanine amidase AmpD
MPRTTPTPPDPAPPPTRTIALPRISVQHQLSDDNYTREITEKTAIVLHHTVGGSAYSTFKYWQEDVPAPGAAPKRSTVATPFIIDRDGTVFQVHDPHYWSFHLGISDLPRGQMDRRSIGIELASEGALTKKDGKVLAFYNPNTKKGVTARDPYYDHGVEWRGYRYFDEYERAQIDSLVALCEYLFLVFPTIPRRTPLNHIEFNRKHYKFNGVIGHHQVREDKTDVHPNFPWIEFCSRLELEQVPSP